MESSPGLFPSRGLLKRPDMCRLPVVAVADGGGGDDRVEGVSLSTQTPWPIPGRSGVQGHRPHIYRSGLPAVTGRWRRERPARGNALPVRPSTTATGGGYIDRSGDQPSLADVTGAAQEIRVRPVVCSSGVVWAGMLSR